MVRAILMRLWVYRVSGAYRNSGYYNLPILVTEVHTDNPCKILCTPPPPRPKAYRGHVANARSMSSG